MNVDVVYDHVSGCYGLYLDEGFERQLRSDEAVSEIIERTKGLSCVLKYHETSKNEDEWPDSLQDVHVFVFDDEESCGDADNCLYLACKKMIDAFEYDGERLTGSVYQARNSMVEAIANYEASGNVSTWYSYHEVKPMVGEYILATCEINGELTEPSVGVFTDGVTQGGTGIARISEHPNDWVPVGYWIPIPKLPDIKTNKGS